MKEKTLSELLIELGVVPEFSDINALDGDGTNRHVLDGKPQNEEKSQE